MRCAWQELTALIPLHHRQEVDKYRDTLQEVRMRLGQVPELVTQKGRYFAGDPIRDLDLRFTVNAASRYSPWAAATTAQGFLTAPGGHRIGLCGSRTPGGVANLTSLNIRVARDFHGIGDRLPTEGNILILGPPGSGKTTLLRDLIRSISRSATVAVVDEREELFPVDFDRGVRTDVLSGYGKPEGIDMVLRAMGPEVIAVDEITAESDCIALQKAQWCGVRLIATAHASTAEDFMRRTVYKPLTERGCFDTLVVLQRDKSWHIERAVL